MVWLIATLLIVLLTIGAPFYYLYARRRRRSKRISELLAGVNVLASWRYTAEQWRQVVEEEFTWARKQDGSGHIYISPDSVYVKSDSGGRFIELAGGGRVVTHASFSGGDMSLLKLRVRRKEVHHHQDRADEVKYYRDDYRIPVPAAHQEEAHRVVNFFTSLKEKNLKGYADTVSEDEPLSLFGNDAF